MFFGSLPQLGHRTGEIASREAVIAGSSHVRGPSVTNGCMSCGGDITRWVEASPQAVFSLATTFPAALVCTRSLAGASAGNVAAQLLQSLGWHSKGDENFFLATVVPDGQGARVDKLLGIVNGEDIIGANIFLDMFTSVRGVVGGRAGPVATSARCLGRATRRWTT